MCYTVCKYQDELGGCSLGPDESAPLDAICIQNIFKDFKPIKHLKEKSEKLKWQQLEGRE
jgi:hypothetical protein